MKKILFVAKVDSHIKHFQEKYFEDISKMGYTIDVMSEGDISFLNTRKKFNINFGNNPFSVNNYRNYKKISKILHEEKYDIIQCNTAVASVIIRLIKLTNELKAKIVYMAHGFHFYKNGPFKDWILFFPIEKFLGLVTDKLVLINMEDFNLAKRHCIGKQQVIIPGVGVEFHKFQHINTKIKGLSQKKTIVFSYIAEINSNKNHKQLIDVMLKLKRQGLQFKCNFIGDGVLIDKYKSLIKKMDLENEVFFLGYKNNIEDYLKNTDIYISASRREGFGLNLVEALAAGIPVICSQNRGHSEIILEGYNGFFANSSEEFVEKINELIVNEEKYIMLANNTKKSVKQFSYENVKKHYINAVIK